MPLFFITGESGVMKKKNGSSAVAEAERGGAPCIRIIFSSDGKPCSGARGGQ